MGDLRLVAPLFLVSLTAGYIFCSGYTATRWAAARSEGQRLLFESAKWGIFLTLASAFLHQLIRPAVSLDFYSWLTHFDVPYLSVFSGSFVLSLLLPRLLNWLDEDAGRRIIAEHGTELEKLMVQAFDKELMVMLTLSNKKFI